MPLKWKIFRAVNYIQFIWFLLMLLFWFIQISQVTVTTTRGNLTVLLVMIALIIPVVNCLVNLHILSHYYPGKTLSKQMRRFHSIISVLYAISILAYLILLILVVVDLPPGLDLIFYIAICLSGLMAICGMYILLTQVHIYFLLERSARKPLEDLDESLRKLSGGNRN